MLTSGIYRSVFAAIVLAGCSSSPSNDGNSTAPPADAGLLGDGETPLDSGDGAISGDSGVSPFVFGEPGDGAALPGLLSSVQIVTVTWTRDDENIAAQIATAFAAPGLASSAWWGALSSYC